MNNQRLTTIFVIAMVLMQIKADVNSNMDEEFKKDYDKVEQITSEIDKITTHLLDNKKIVGKEGYNDIEKQLNDLKKQIDDIEKKWQNYHIDHSKTGDKKITDL